MVYVISLLLVSFVTAAHALNDWTKPCLSGICSYDMPATGGPSGSMKIWGDKTAISDITPAAGWEIMGCSPDKLAQDVRLVCNSDDSKGAGCSHLFEGGAEGTIVRLPQACGKNAFARVAKSWVPKDQTIPAHIMRRIVRRDGTQPKVEALTLDTNFGAIDASKRFGTVQFALKGANIPGAAGEIDVTTVGARRSTSPSRIYDKERSLRDFAHDAIDAIGGLNGFDVDKSTDLNGFSVDKNVHLVDSVLVCPPITASLGVEVDIKAIASASIGVAASGTIIPPNIEDFSVITSLSADIASNVTLTASLIGTLASKRLNIFEVGVPGLSFPGVLTIGPTFEIDVEVLAKLDVLVDLTVGVNYKVDKAQLVFPPSSKRAQAADEAFKVLDTPVKLSVSPFVKATGSLEAHVVPSLNLKVSALGDLVEAGISLELDASAFMTLSLEAPKDVNITPPNESALKGRYWAPPHAPRNFRTPILIPFPVITKYASTSVEAASTVSSVSGNKTADSTAVSTATNPVQTGIPVSDSDVPFTGCFGIGAGLDVNAKADSGFFKIFEKAVKVNLFAKKFELFKRCTGDARPLPEPPKVAVILTCPTSGIHPPVPLADAQVVPAASIKTV